MLENDISITPKFEQLSLFDDVCTEKSSHIKAQNDKERKKQIVMLDIKKKYGKNAIIRGMNLEEGSTAMSRNKQIGGHKA
jgi:DNA polymerase V